MKDVEELKITIRIVDGRIVETVTERGVLEES